jgi:hypothetical protein
MKFFKTTFPGIRFAATDLDWTSGSGELVSGAANDLALTVAGRGKASGAISRLSGPGVSKLT